MACLRPASNRTRTCTRTHAYICTHSIFGVGRSPGNPGLSHDPQPSASVHAHRRDGLCDGRACGHVALSQAVAVPRGQCVALGHKGGCGENGGSVTLQPAAPTQALVVRGVGHRDGRW